MEQEDLERRYAVVFRRKKYTEVLLCVGTVKIETTAAADLPGMIESVAKLLATPPT
jgi:hypothetical protein